MEASRDETNEMKAGIYKALWH